MLILNWFHAETCCGNRLLVPWSYFLRNLKTRMDDVTRLFWIKSNVRRASKRTLEYNKYKAKHLFLLLKRIKLYYNNNYNNSNNNNSKSIYFHCVVLVKGLHLFLLLPLSRKRKSWKWEKCNCELHNTNVLVFTTKGSLCHIYVDPFP